MRDELEQTTAELVRNGTILQGPEAILCYRQNAHERPRIGPGTGPCGFPFRDKKGHEEEDRGRKVALSVELDENQAASVSELLVSPGRL
ncbi:MAG: hypothetical protein OEN21_12850 [Myxococcales bacterium]|nr:hypothetical protein [Myxococcales bacterium]